jgi:hypothetical protein
MKRAILLTTLIFLVTSQKLSASHAHIPCNMAYSIASYANAILNRLYDEKTDASAPLVQALIDVKESYIELGNFLTNTAILRDHSLVLMDVAAILLDRINLNHRAELSSQREFVERMITINERLRAAI